MQKDPSGQRQVMFPFDAKVMASGAVVAHASGHMAEGP
jgi:hypothetical protein